MSSNAVGAQRYVAIHEMVGDPKVIPPTPAMQKLLTSGDTLASSPIFVEGENFSSNRIKEPGRYIRDDVQGDISFDLVSLFSGADNPLLVAALWADAWRNTHDAGWDGLSLEGAVFTASGSTLDMTSAVNLANFTINDYDEFRVRGTANGNDAIYQLVETGTGTNIYTVTPAVTADETCGAAVLMDGRTINNGGTAHNFLIERGHVDINEYLVFLGMVANVLQVDIANETTVKASLSFIGRLEDDPSATPITGATYTNEPTANPIYSVNNDTDIYLDGVLVENCLFESLSFTVDNSAVGKSGAGVNGLCDVVGLTLNLSVSLTMAFQSTTYRQKMKNGTPFSLDFVFNGTDNSALKIKLPRIVLTSDSIPVSGPEDIIENAEGSAHADLTSGRGIQISEFPAYS